MVWYLFPSERPRVIFEKPDDSQYGDKLTALVTLNANRMLIGNICFIAVNFLNISVLSLGVLPNQFFFMSTDWIRHPCLQFITSADVLS